LTRTTENLKNCKRAAGLLACLAALALAACAKPPRALDTTAEVSDSIYKKPQPKAAEGSIWPGDSFNNIFFSDIKAREVGDIITVLIQEDATSTHSASTDTSKDTEIDFQTNTFFGLDTHFGMNNFLGSADPFNPGVNASTSRSNQGSGTTSRQGRLAGTLSVMVTEVYPNGNMVIAGSRMVTVNNEHQIMNLKGVVRPIDVNFDNTVASRFIANANITYTGDGIVADEQRVGWLTRILGWVWPF